MPWFEVQMTALCVCVVKADSEEDAFEIAHREVSEVDYEFVEAEANALSTPAAIDAAKRHANKVVHAHV